MSGVPFLISEGIGKLCGLPGVHMMLGDGLAPPDIFKRAIVKES